MHLKNSKTLNQPRTSPAIIDDTSNGGGTYGMEGCADYQCPHVCSMFSLLLSIYLFLMKEDIMVQNCQGVANLKFHRVAKEYLRDFDPVMVILVETRVSGAQANLMIKRLECLIQIEWKLRAFSVVFGSLEELC